MTSQDALAQRYGGKPSRWLLPVLGLLGAALLGIIFMFGWALLSHSSPEVESELVTFDIVDEHTATALISVNRSDDDVEATCLVRAFAEDHSVVGELSWTPDGEAQQEEDVTIRTERTATSIELVGCTTEDQSRPR